MKSLSRACTVLLGVALLPMYALASSHREAPAIAGMPRVDGADFTLRVAEGAFRRTRRAVFDRGGRRESQGHLLAGLSLLEHANPGIAQRPESNRSLGTFEGMAEC